MQRDAESLGVTNPIALLSPDTLAKQLVRHPELTTADYRMIQRVMDKPTQVISEGPRNMIFIQNDPEGTGYVIVVKAVVTKDEVFMTSFRRLSTDQAKRDREVARLLKKRI